MRSLFSYLSTLLSFLSFARLILSFPAGQGGHGQDHDHDHDYLPHFPLPNRIVHQFPLPTWLENLAVRPNGQILVTVTTAAQVYLVDPSKPASAAPVLIHDFAPKSAVIGITEVRPDIFYVAVGKVDIFTFTNYPGTYSIWEINMSGNTPAIRKVTDVPEANFLNGLTTLSIKDNTILAADCVLGLIWKINVTTGKYEKVIDNPSMKLPPPPALSLGVNGIKIHDGKLYFTNTGAGTLNRIPINLSTGKATGSAENLYKGIFPDDIAIDEAGNVWIARNGENILSVWISDTRKLVDVLGKKTELTVAGATACAFGQSGWGGGGDGDGGGKVLYVSTSGALAGPVNGTIVEGGKVVAVDLSGF